MKEAMFWESGRSDVIHCKLCYRNCMIPLNGVGFCRTRKNIQGKLYSLNYGKACALNIDPIEKKPFYHYMPGARAFSISSPGCNFKCLHCCNPSISQAVPGTVDEKNMTVENVAKLAVDSRSEVMAFTYTEPTVFYEYARDIGIITRKNNLKNVFVSNGYAQTEVIKDAVKNFLDAVRIDLKGDENHYRKICGNVELENVLKCIKDYYKTGIPVEIITLVIENDNDNKEFVERMAEFLKGLGKDGKNIPWHFIRFYPSYLMKTTPETKIETLEKMHKWAVDSGMNYPYVGNVPGHELNNTYCHNCHELLIKRMEFGVSEVYIKKDNKCPKCGAKIPVKLK